MKKIVLAVAALIAFAAAAQATIVGSKHDLGSAGAARTAYTLTGPTEICVYCHTPHNPTVNVPLWNRNNPTSAGWTFYQSPTLSPAAQAASFKADSVSLFCMSCHDGVTGLGDIKNLRTNAGNPIGAASYANIGAGGTTEANAGKTLTNDHPVGFSYDTAQGVDAGLKTKTSVNTALGYNGQGVFFGAGADQMECASCHKVHEAGTSGNFLRKENGLSALCLDCHAK
jgi:predicted CXXCH cytochrome family protein